MDRTGGGSSIRYLEDLYTDGVHGHHECYQCISNGRLGIQDATGGLWGRFLTLDIR